MKKIRQNRAQAHNGQHPHNPAVARGALAPWTSTVWIVVDQSGHVAAHRQRSNGERTA